MPDVQSFRNHLLIATPTLADYFRSSVSLLIDHNDEGAFGLMINRPRQIRLRTVFPKIANAFDCPVLEGGPVEPDRVFFLHEQGPAFDATYQVGDGVYLTTSPDFVELMIKGEAPKRTLAILGYAGWGSQQLEHEIGENAWFLAPSDAGIVFDVPFAARAGAAARLLGVDLNLILPAAGDDPRS